MELRKLRSGRVEVAVCILGPLLALAAIMIPGRLYCRQLARRLAERQALLEQAPRLETQLAESRRVLQPFAASGAEGDRAAELTLVAERAAQMAGFTTRSVNVAKQGEGGSWVDYRVAMNGAGPLRSVIAMLDSLEQPARRFRVGSATFRATGLGAGAVYEGDVVLTSRAIGGTGASGPSAAAGVSAAHAAAQAGRLSLLTASVKAWAAEKRVSLKGREVGVGSKPVLPETSRSACPFRLNGVVRDRRNPLALTDRGVLGVGESIDGYTLRSVADDSIVVVGPDGYSEIVRLYADDVRP